MVNLFMEQPTQIKVLGISGSLRQASFNSSLLRVAQEETPAGMEIVAYNLASLPFYDRDVEEQGDPDPVTDFKTAISEADGVLFVTPEYNFSPSGVLKNAIDWASRDRRPAFPVRQACDHHGSRRIRRDGAGADAPAQYIR